MIVICSYADECNYVKCKHKTPHDSSDKKNIDCITHKLCYTNNMIILRKCISVLSFKNELDKIFDI